MADSSVPSGPAGGEREDTDDDDPGLTVDAAMRDRLQRRRQWRDAIKRDDMIPKLLDAARAGDDEAAVALWAQIAECQPSKGASPALPRKGGAEPAPRRTGNPTPAPETPRCVRLRETMSGSERKPEYWRDRAAFLGNGPAALFQAQDSAYGDAQARRDALQAAFASRDPAVMFLLGSQASRDSDYRVDHYNDTTNARATMTGEILAACGLGEDCSADGERFKQLCTRQTVGCDRAASVQELYRLRLSPGQFGEARRHANELLRSYQGPMEDSREAQATLRLIDPNRR